MKRPNGEGQSRTKWSALLLGVWSLGARVAGVPEEIVDGVSGTLVGAIGWFLRDAR